MEQEVKIESGIEMPIRRGGAKKYPFRDMKVGDSFFIGSVPLSMPATRSKVSTAAYQYGKKKSIKFSLRSVDGGVRCWRIE